MNTALSREEINSDDFSSKDDSNPRENHGKKKKRKRGSPCLLENCQKYKKSYINFESHLHRIHRIKLQEYGEIFRKDVDKTLLKNTQESSLKKRKMSKSTWCKKYGRKVQVFNGLTNNVNKLRDKKRENDKQSRLRDNQNDVIVIPQKLRDNRKSFENKTNENESNEITDKVLFTVREDPVTQELDCEIIRKEFSSHMRKFTYDLVQLTKEERSLVENVGINLNSLRELQENKLKKS